MRRLGFPARITAKIAASILVIFLAPAAQAQPLSKVCTALSQNLQQSSAALEGRILSEALFEAAALDCLEIAQDMLARGASPQARNRLGANALSVAAQSGSIAVAELLIAAGTDIHHTDLNGAAPMLQASTHGRRRMVRLLLAQGADPEQGNDQGITPLMAAAFNGDLRLVGTLIKAGVAVDAEDQSGKTALIYAAGRAYTKVARVLIENGADADRPRGHNLTPIMWAAGHANDAPESDGILTAQLLLEAHVQLEHRDDRGRSALMIAAGRGHAKMVGLLLAHGADPSARDKAGKTAAQLTESAQIKALLQP